MTENTPPMQRRGARFRLIAIILVFTGPLVFAFAWYYGFGGRFAPSAQSNHAPLITPPVSIAEFDNPVIGGGRYTRESLERLWTVIHRVDGDCGETCRAALYNTRQTRIAVGKDIRRIQRVILVSESAAAAMQDLRGEHGDAVLVMPTGSGLGAQVSALLESAGAGADDAVLVDPLGNAMMVIPAGLDPALLLKDLKKLLKLSRVG